MAWVTEINADEQVDYRLRRQAGCGVVAGDGRQVEAGEDDQVDYRLESDADGVLVWFGSGLDAVGLKAGTVLDADGEAAARHLMKGCHPQTGARLITTKTSVRADERATLTVAPLLRAIEAKAAEEGVEPDDLLEEKPKQLAKFKQQQRMVKRRGEAQRLHVDTVHKLARAAGVDLAAVYGEDAVAAAWENKDLRVDSRVRGWDLVLDLTKSDSTLDALLPDLDEQTFRELVHQAKDDTLRVAEQLIGYAVGSEDGEPVRIATGGLLGWSVEHRAARPMGDGQPGDPHLHLHVVIANMALCEDGKWRSIANSGSDLYRHAAVLDAVFKARVRQLAHERFGVRRLQSATTRAWEIEGIPQQLRDHFSRRAALVNETVGEDASLEDKLRVSATTRRAKHEADANGMRASWRERAEALGIDVDAMVADAAPGPPGPDGGVGIDGPGGGPRIPPPSDIARIVFDPETGVTASQKDFTRAKLMAAVVNALPYGFGGAELSELQHLVDDVLRVEGYAVPLPHLGSTVMSNTDRYTTQDVLDAEDVAVTQARERFADNTVRLTTEQADAAMSVFAIAAGFELSQQQREVVTRLLTAGNGIDTVVGVAGAGKSTLMDACRIAWDATGTTYAGACLSAVGAQGLQDASAIPSRTVASWIQRIESGEGLTGIDVLVIDEAVMTDDRSAAKLLTEAARTGTQVLAIGDPLQLQAVGIGGWFREVHRLVGGLTLDENRRQRDDAERAALDIWRTGNHQQALEVLAAAERVHAVETADEARSEMLMAWDKLRQDWPDELDLLENLTVLAARNDDVDLLNAGAQEIRRAAGELGEKQHTYALPGGRTLVLSENDVVRVRENDYRSRRGEGPDILNGYRATITAIDDDHRVQITWRAKDPTARIGITEASAWLDADAIAGGALSLGYAMTVAASQGLTCHTSLLYGHGANAYATYPGITRGREANHIWLPLQVVEDERTQRELGRARTETELLQRSIHAFAAYLGQARPDGMISDELRAAPEPVAVPHQVERGTAREEIEAALRNARASRERTARAGRAKSPSLHHRRWQEAQRRAELAAAQEARARDDEERQEYDTGQDGATDGIKLSDEQKNRLNEIARQREMREVTPLNQRPYGPLPDADLRSQIGWYLEAAEHAEEQVLEAREEYRERSETLARDAAAGTSRGRRFATAADVVLTAAEKQLTRAREEETAARAAKEEAKQAREHYDKTGTARQAGHITLALSGTTKRGVKKATDKLVGQRMAAEGEEMRARSAARDARAAAWKMLADSEQGQTLGATGQPPGDTDELAKRLREMRTALPDRALAMDARDLRQRNAAHGKAESAATTATELRAGIEQVRDEQKLRARIQTQFPELHRTETQARANQATEQSRKQVAHEQAASASLNAHQGRGGPRASRP
ncbi:MobF family relaxase [Streptomyces acidiscabies]|uniref:MobF family relaxase n=1 Tax=Streptomyces acidiscabies TaxID=42234 RepID=A0ABU4MB67_9ACTN|nr:MobF family relaxase [Streptomyces acidiscabies]MDX3025369.1 MobF family relaxase [Streptomyces acidiscabies]